MCFFLIIIFQIKAAVGHVQISKCAWDPAGSNVSIRSVVHMAPVSFAACCTAHWLLFSSTTFLPKLISFITFIWIQLPSLHKQHKQQQLDSMMNTVYLASYRNTVIKQKMKALKEVCLLHHFVIGQDDLKGRTKKLSYTCMHSHVHVCMYTCMQILIYIYIYCLHPYVSSSHRFSHKYS